MTIKFLGAHLNVRAVSEVQLVHSGCKKKINKISFDFLDLEKTFYQSSYSYSY